MYFFYLEPCPEAYASDTALDEVRSRNRASGDPARENIPCAPTLKGFAVASVVLGVVVTALHSLN